MGPGGPRLHLRMRLLCNVVGMHDEYVLGVPGMLNGTPEQSPCARPIHGPENEIMGGVVSPALG